MSDIFLRMYKSTILLQRERESEKIGEESWEMKRTRLRKRGNHTGQELIWMHWRSERKCLSKKLSDTKGGSYCSEVKWHYCNAVFEMARTNISCQHVRWCLSGSLLTNFNFKYANKNFIRSILFDVYSFFNLILKYFCLIFTKFFHFKALFGS